LLLLIGVATLLVNLAITGFRYSALVSRPTFTTFSVVPAKAGTHKPAVDACSLWIPAFAGMTGRKFHPSEVCAINLPIEHIETARFTLKSGVFPSALYFDMKDDQLPIFGTTSLSNLKLFTICKPVFHILINKVIHSLIGSRCPNYLTIESTRI